MILPIPTPTRSHRKIKPRWDRYYDEPVPGDYWGLPSEDDGTQQRAPITEPRLSLH